LKNQTYFVTGGAGFIGSALVRQLIDETDITVVNIDKLTYAGNLDSLSSVFDNPRHTFEKVDICDSGKIENLFTSYQPDAVIHLAAESHVDRSIDGPSDFLQTNVIGTYTMLEAARKYWKNLDKNTKNTFRFLHISTDEVYGTLGKDGFFTENTSYKPNSPYSASKASSDHFVRAWYHTYGFPTLITNCSNNYGPYQFPEKLIPVVILNAMAGKNIPVYGEGKNVRDWLYVEDHVRALLTVLDKGRLGETYVIGGKNEKNNLEVVKQICFHLDELMNKPGISKHESLITYVKDRPGHDMRYAIDPKKISTELGWEPLVTFEQGLKMTVKWYLENNEWIQRAMSGQYRLERLGLDKE